MATQLDITPEVLVPRLGEYLIRQGRINHEDLKKALDYQQEQMANGIPCLLGQALIKLGLLDHNALDQAVTEQIIQLRNALEATNRSLERRVQERTKELQEALRRLSELNQLKANFVSTISHELRTPLTHIKGYLELLSTQSLGMINKEQADALQVSQRAANRLENLIEDLIMFALASRGELSLKPEAVDIRHLVNQSINLASQKAEERGISIHANIDKDLPLVQADTQKIAWVLSQLLDNAIKFTSSGGQVVLRVENHSKEMVDISITDTGIGIPANRLEEIFEPFHQLNGSSTRRHGGIGLGLSLVRQIVEAHGSTIEVISGVGKGCTFTFPLLAIEKAK